MSKTTVRHVADIALQAVSDVTGISRAEILGSQRIAHISQARHLAMWLTRTLAPHASWREIGRSLGAKHDASVRYAVRRISAARGDLARLRERVRDRSEVQRAASVVSNELLPADIRQVRIALEEIADGLAALISRLGSLEEASNGL